MGLQHQRHVSYIANIFGLCHHGNGGLVLIMDDGYETTMNRPLLLQQVALWMALTTYRLLLMARVVHFECFHCNWNAHGLGIINLKQMYNVQYFPVK